MAEMDKYIEQLLAEMEVEIPFQKVVKKYCRRADLGRNQKEATSAIASRGIFSKTSP